MKLCRANATPSFATTSGGCKRRSPAASVHRYGSGEEALRGFGRYVPDLIVLDIWLPDIDGVQVLKRLRMDDRLKDVPAIAFTANAMLGDREKYLAAGFNEYVSKPIMDFDGFLQMIRRIVATSTSSD